MHDDIDQLTNSDIYALLQNNTHENLPQEMLSSRIIYLFRGDDEELEKVKELQSQINYADSKNCIEFNVINMQE